MTSMRVVLADDHTLFRAGLRALLEKLPDVQVVAEARDGREAVHLVETHHPDLVLMDIAMPGLNGLEATRRLVQACPAIRVLILSMHKSEEYVWQALWAGAAGYLLKDADLAELTLALEQDARTRDSQRLEAELLQRIATLTPRERDVMGLVSTGLLNKEIAYALGTSEKTVKAHRAHVMQKMRATSVAELVRMAALVERCEPQTARLWSLSYAIYR
jgi:DNA-binding NarL/FixJ family response regulator